MLGGHNIELVEGVKEIAREAGNLIMTEYSRGESTEVETKGDNSPLTVADRVSHDHICSRLKDLANSFPVVSEENIQEFSLPIDSSAYWLVDPLDGTKEFINRTEEFTVNIALIYQSKPVLGVVYAPVTQELYWAVSGAGAFYRNFSSGDFLRIRSRKSIDVPVVTVSRSHLGEKEKAFLNEIGETMTLSLGSSLKICRLAEGKVDLYPRFVGSSEWDIAAAHIILLEAGGNIFSSSDVELEYNKVNILNPPFIAFGQGVEAEKLECFFGLVAD